MKLISLKMNDPMVNTIVGSRPGYWDEESRPELIGGARCPVWSEKLRRQGGNGNGRRRHRSERLNIWILIEWYQGRSGGIGN